MRRISNHLVPLVVFVISYIYTKQIKIMFGIATFKKSSVVLLFTKIVLLVAMCFRLLLLKH